VLEWGIRSRPLAKHRSPAGLLPDSEAPETLEFFIEITRHDPVDRCGDSP
jgi:hypothetical protein